MRGLSTLRVGGGLIPVVVVRRRGRCYARLVHTQTSRQVIGLGVDEVDAVCNLEEALTLSPPRLDQLEAAGETTRHPRPAWTTRQPGDQAGRVAQALGAGPASESRHHAPTTPERQP